MLPILKRGHSLLEVTFNSNLQNDLMIQQFKNILLLGGVGAFLCLQSCKKGLLDVAPPDRLSTAVFWQSESDADLALTGLYNYLYSSGGGYATSQFTMIAWDNFSDDSYGQYNY